MNKSLKTELDAILLAVARQNEAKELGGKVKGTVRVSLDLISHLIEKSGVDIFYV